MPKIRDTIELEAISVVQRMLARLSSRAIGLTSGPPLVEQTVRRQGAQSIVVISIQLTYRCRRSNCQNTQKTQTNEKQKGWRAQV